MTAERWPAALVWNRYLLAQVDVVVIKVQTQVKAFFIVKPPKTIVERIRSLNV
jgi:hypothetical protein